MDLDHKEDMVYIHTHICMYIYTHTHTYIYVHKHTHHTMEYYSVIKRAEIMSSGNMDATTRTIILSEVNQTREQIPYNIF